MIDLKERLFERHPELTEDLLKVITNNNKVIRIPSKTEAKLKYISKKDLLTVSNDVELSKEIILVVLSNFSNTYLLSFQGSNERIRQGYKRLSSVTLQKMSNVITGYSSYASALKILMDHKIIEKGNSYIVGKRSNEYRLTNTYFGKGIVNYELKYDILINRRRTNEEINLDKVMECPIAKNELLKRDKIVFPTQEEAKKFLIGKAKEGYTNKKGKRLIYLNNRNKDNYPDCVFVEDYLLILDYLSKIIIPIVTSERGGHRVITAFNYLPSVLRTLVKFNGSKVTEVDYGCLHPNICQAIYGGTNTETFTHTKVAEFLGISREEAKIEHLSFFNKEWDKMSYSPLFKYYTTKQTTMMENIYKVKETSPVKYKQTSQDCLLMETHIMRDNIIECNKQGIDVLYCFDSLACNPKDVPRLKKIMKATAEKYGIEVEVD